MKKFLSLFVICLVIANYACAMEELSEQLPDMLSYLMVNKPNEIVGFLDLESLCSFSQTCKLYKEICDAVPTKYLGFDPCDAAKLKNTTLMERFLGEMKKIIAQPDLLFASSGAEEVFCSQEEKEENVVKIFKWSFSKHAQHYCGNRSLYYVMQGDRMGHCFSAWEMPTLQGKQKFNTTLLWNSREWLDDSVDNAITEYVEKNFSTSIIASVRNWYHRIFKNYYFCAQDGRVLRNIGLEDGCSEHKKTMFELSKGNDKIKSFALFVFYLSLRQYGIAIERSVITPLVDDYKNHLDQIEEPS